MLLRTPNQAIRTSPLVVEAASQRYMQTMQFLYLGGLVDTIADIMPEIKRRIRPAWACYNRFKRELYDMVDAPFVVVWKGSKMRTGPCPCCTLRPSYRDVCHFSLA